MGSIKSNFSNDILFIWKGRVFYLSFGGLCVMAANLVINPVFNGYSGLIVVFSPKSNTIFRRITNRTVQWKHTIRIPFGWLFRKLPPLPEWWSAGRKSEMPALLPGSSRAEANPQQEAKRWGWLTPWLFFFLSGNSFRVVSVELHSHDFL